MDWLTILNFPNDEGIVLSETGKEFVIRAELQFQNLVLDSTKDSHRSASLHVPKDDRCIGHSLEDCTFLSRSDDVARVRDGESGDLHVMTAKELLLMLVHQVFDNEKATDVVHQGVLHGRVELYRVWVTSIVAERVVHLKHLLSTLFTSWNLHGCNIARRLVSFFCAEDARLQVLLSVHFC